MKVAVTSRSFSKNPELRRELSARYPNVTFNDQGLTLVGDSLVNFLQGHERAITALEVIDETVVSKLPQLKLISKYGVGLDMIDLAALHRHGIQLAWSGGVNKRAVAELALFFILGSLRGSFAAHDAILKNTWKQWVGANLTGKTVGIVGLGHIGKDVATLLQPFSCRILAHDLKPFPAFCSSNGVTPVGLDELLAQADAVSLHLPLDASTRGLLGAERLSLLKRSAVLINTSRGSIVDEGALKQRLRAGELAGAAFDVFEKEPPADRELLELPNFFCTPHIGGSSAEAILAMGRAAIDGLEAGKEALPEHFS